MIAEFAKEWAKVIKEKERLVRAVVDIRGVKWQHNEDRWYELVTYAENTDFWESDREGVFRYCLGKAGDYGVDYEGEMPEDLVEDYMSGAISLEEARARYSEWEEGGADESMDIAAYLSEE